MASYTAAQNENSTSTSLETPYSPASPSEETYQEIENLANNTNESVSLRSAPPGGTPIGGVYLETPSVLTLAIPLMIYLVIKSRRRIHPFRRQRASQ